MLLVETHNLTKEFGNLVAVDRLTLSVRTGEILALLGPNGAGKTTTIRMLSSILRPSGGWARIEGFDVVSQAQEVRRRIGLLTEHHGLYTRMRSMEYLGFFGQAYGMTSAQIERRSSHLLEKYGLSQDADRRLGEFSKGMRQKLVLVRALLHDPAVVLLDEPTSAMDPESALLVRESIAAMRSSRRAIIVCTHNLHEAESLADRIAIISKGRIVQHGTLKDLRRTLLGDPVMEMCLAEAVDGAVGNLPEGLTLLSAKGNVIRYRTAEPTEVNPRVLAAMAQAGLNVVTLGEVGRSLEDVYLQVVGGRHPETGRE